MPSTSTYSLPIQLRRVFTLGLAITLLLSGCGKSIEDAIGTNKIRINAVRSAATTYGAQIGLATQSKLINKTINKKATDMDRIFNFNRILLAHNVLPPILVESRNNLNLDGPEAIRLSDRTYQIAALARFVTAPPSWRDYLYLDYTMPDKPDFSLLPSTAEERILWNQGLVEGWKNGIAQADEIFKENLNTLKRDFTGMALYHSLAAKNIISAPYVAKAKLGVTGNTQELHINDQVLRITANAGLQPDSSYWQPALSHKKATSK